MKSGFLFGLFLAAFLGVCYLMATGKGNLGEQIVHFAGKVWRRDVQPVMDHGKDPKFKVPPLVREDRQTGQLVRVREK